MTMATKKTPVSSTRKTTKPKVEAPMIVKAESPAARPAVKRAAKPEPTHGQIAQRAFELFAGRGYAHGQHIQDWLQAERELRD
jgi:hypothetical protein